MSIHWTNKGLPFIHHEVITEWDMKSANTSLMRFYHLASNDEIDKIESLSKDKREVYVGNKSRRDKEFGQKLEKAFTNIIEKFIQDNGLDRDEDIISIKKDAVFVRNRAVKVSRYGDSVLFRSKGVYSGFMLLPKYEFYITSNGSMDVKGINDNLLSLHKDGVLEFIAGVFMEAQNDRELQLFMKEYSSLYKDRRLLFNAYRQFDTNSKFRVNLYGNMVDMDDINESLLQYLDISYNYLNVYLPTLKLVIGR